jgi:hypothetical protein
MPRRRFPILATVGLAAAMFGLPVPGAGAADNGICWVRNTTLRKSYGPGTGSVLQAAINQAGADNRLEVRGRCVGIYSTSSLTLVGVSKAGYPVATLDANGSGRVITITGVATSVSLRRLKVTRGSTTDGGAGISTEGRWCSPTPR